MRLVAGVAVLLLLLAACGGDDERLAVFAAASLTDVLEELDPRARYNFAGSDELATQILEGAPADVYASAGGEPMQRLRAAGLVDAPFVVATNELVVVVPRDNPAGIERPADLADPGVRIVLAGESVPVGAYAREALRLLDIEAALRNVVSEEQDVKGVAAKVALGEADAGIVYATDVAAIADRVRTIPLRVDVGIRYYAAIVRVTDRREAAKDFLERLVGPEGRAALQAAGFGEVP